MRRLLSSILADLAPLWVAGLGVLQILLLSATLPLAGEPYEWAQYLLLGAAFPVLVLMLQYGVRREAMRAALGVGCFIPLAMLVGPGWNHCVLCGVGQALLLLGWLRVRVRVDGMERAFPVRGVGVAVGMALAVLGWFVVRRWVWWSEFPGWLSGSGYHFGVGIAALLFATAAVGELSVPRAEGGRFGGWFVNGAAMGVFGFLSTHIYDLGLTDAPGGTLGRTTFHHWGAIVESADLVRQGGWPLWDIPTQYGFLNTWIVAGLPMASVWQSFYVCNAVLLTLSAGIVFWLLRSLRPEWIFTAFALVVATAAVFWIPGEVPLLTGPFPYPSVGAYRFFWCFALLGVLAWDYETLRRGMRDGRRTLWLGSLVWLAGVLWSAESAIYCTTVWVPCYTLLALRRVVECYLGTGKWRRRLTALAGWLALPPLLLTVAIGLVCAIYQSVLGHWPDARCLVEYCLALQFFALPIDPAGAVGVLLLAYFTIATIGANCLRDAKPLEPLPVVVGSAAALWAVSSYFVGRSHDNNVINLTPIVVACLAASLRVLDRVPPGEAWASWVKVSLMSVAAVLLTMPFINRAAVEQYLDDSKKGYCADITRLLPVADVDLNRLLAEAGVTAETPIAFFDNDATLPCGCPRWQVGGAAEWRVGTRAWLPAESMVLYMPLSPERRRIYFERFNARAERSGWLVRPNAEPTPVLAGILEEIRRTHTRGATLRNASWTMTWYEYLAKE